jgi:hypothetical protein
MSNDNETPEEIDEPEIEGVDSDDLANLEVDPAELDDESEPDGDEDGELADDVAGAEVSDETETDATDATVDETDERLNLEDDEEETKKPSKGEEDENEFASADDEEADLATILKEKLRSGEDLPPEEDGEVVESEDVTDGTVLLQPRRPDEEHCQQCYLLVRKSAPKCPEDHDLCPLFPSVARN